MTTTPAEARLRNTESQRRRRARPESKEIDRAYMAEKRNAPRFRLAESLAAKAERRNPETWARYILRNIKHRAKSKGIEFSLTPEDLSLPDVCPVLGIKLVIGIDHASPMCPNSPSVDRLDNAKGYTPDNIRIISNRANLLKRDANTSEIRAILAYMERENVP